MLSSIEKVVPKKFLRFKYPILFGIILFGVLMFGMSMFGQTRAIALQTFSLLISSLALTVAIASFFSNRKLAHTHIEISKRQNTIKLYEQYYSPDNYMKVVSVVGVVNGKWLNLEDEAKKRYQREVVRGWVLFYDPSRYPLKDYIKDTSLSPDANFFDIHYKENQAMSYLS